MGIYEQLGVKKLINAYGTVTRIGGSLMSPEVLEAMIEAAKNFLNLDELLEKAGERIAEITGAEAAFVTSGAAAGMTIATAACIAGTNQAEIERLPDTEGMKNEVVALKCHRVRYDQAIRQAGAKIVEVGYVKRSFAWQIEAAVDEKTAAIFYLVESGTIKGSLPLREVIEIAKAARVPVIVNAAAELPPVSNLHKFTDMGADLVIFSGGKDIRGPQDSGLILGRRDLIKACALNSCPNHSIGRPMKVSKEAIVGLVKALELYVEQDFDAEMETWENQVRYFIDHLRGLPCISVRRGFPTGPGIQPTCIPRAYVDLNEEELGMTRYEVINQLRAGELGVLVGESPTGIVLNPQMLNEGEEKRVVKRLKDVLTMNYKKKSPTYE